MKIFEVTEQDVFNYLDELEDYARNDGVNLRISVPDISTLDIDFMERKNTIKGSGKKYLHKLTKFADKHEMNIKLYAYNNNEKLKEYYKNFNFEEDKSTDDEAYMIRYYKK